MTTPMIAIHDLKTDQIVEREMNADELAQWEIEKAAAEATATVEATKNIEKTALLERLGITEDEAKLLLS